MTHHNHSLLDALPYPLMLPQQGKPGIFYGRFIGSRSRPPAAVKSGPLLFERSLELCADSMVFANDFSSSLAEAQLLACELDLRYLCFDVFYPSQLMVTPMVRATALVSRLEKQYYLKGRVSRYTAAWIWGYLPDLHPKIHIDFDRNMRLNVSRAKQRNIITHQVRVIAFDYIQLGKLRITTPMRTALDFLLYDSSSEADRIIISILRDVSNDCTVSRIHEAMDMLTYIRAKSVAVDRLYRLNNHRSD